MQLAVIRYRAFLFLNHSLLYFQFIWTCSAVNDNPVLSMLLLPIEKLLVSVINLLFVAFHSDVLPWVSLSLLMLIYSTEFSTIALSIKSLEIGMLFYTLHLFDSSWNLSSWNHCFVNFIYLQILRIIFLTQIHLYLWNTNQQ